MRAGTASGVQGVWVRGNPGEVGAIDIEALAGIVLAKATSVNDVTRAADQLDRRGDVATALMAMIETAAAVLALADISAAPRITQLHLGDVDLAADLNLRVGSDEVGSRSDSDG